SDVRFSSSCKIWIIFPFFSCFSFSPALELEVDPRRWSPGKNFPLHQEISAVKRSIVMVAVLSVLLIAGKGLLGQDNKAQPKAKGTLPANWSKLGLTDEQKQKIYSAQAEFRGKIDELEKQVADLKKQQRMAMEKVLTDAQKARL